MAHIIAKGNQGDHILRKSKSPADAERSGKGMYDDLQISGVKYPPHIPALANRQKADQIEGHAAHIQEHHEVNAANSEESHQTYMNHGNGADDQAVLILFRFRSTLQYIFQGIIKIHRNTLSNLVHDTASLSDCKYSKSI